MTTEPQFPTEDARQLLSSSQALMSQTRKYQRATWFPLFVMSAVTFGAIPIFRYGNRKFTTCSVPNGGGYACHFYFSWGVWYWPLAFALAYLCISIFYMRRSQAQGIESRIRVFVIAGIVLAGAVTAIGYWVVHLPFGYAHIFGLPIEEGTLGLLHRLATPAGAIGISLLVLVWIERNRALLLVDIVYLIVVLAPINFGWHLNQSRTWNFLPRLVINGGLLLIAGIGFAWVQRPSRKSTK